MIKINIKNIVGGISQRFHEKHFGIDIDSGHGSQIKSYWNEEYVYKVLTVENPSNDGSGFTGVFTIVEQDGEVFEFLYGHCNPLVKVGQKINKGTVIGTQSNNGESYSNGIRITLDMQKAGDTRGSHQHNQMRIIRKDSVFTQGVRYLSALGGGVYFKDGFCYAIPNYETQNGCVNWLEEKVEEVQFKNDLRLGMKNADVLLLQNRLVKEGVATFTTTSYFGFQTLAAVVRYQKAKGITPALGFVGPATRASLNKI